MTGMPAELAGIFAPTCPGPAGLVSRALESVNKGQEEDKALRQLRAQHHLQIGGVNIFGGSGTLVGVLIALFVLAFVKAR